MDIVKIVPPVPLMAQVAETQSIHGYDQKLALENVLHYFQNKYGISN